MGFGERGLLGWVAGGSCAGVWGKFRCQVPVKCLRSHIVQLNLPRCGDALGPLDP